MSRTDLEGKVAIVTGAGVGMGAATCVLFAQRGARVIVSDIDEASGQATADAIVKAGGNASFVRADVSKAVDVDAMVQAAVDRYGRLDCAVNNAGIRPEAHPISELDEADFDRVIEVDLKGVALSMKAELRQLLRQGEGGAIVNIGSASSFRPQANNAAYTAAKHAVIGLTKVAALENAAHGIRVNAVCPGAIDTPMLRGTLDILDTTEAEFAPALSLFGRFGQPEEVAEANLWLCSDAASYVTGATLMVDAGYTSR